VIIIIATFCNFVSTYMSFRVSRCITYSTYDM